MITTIARISAIRVKAPETQISPVPATIQLEVEEPASLLAPWLALIGAPVRVVIEPAQSVLDFVPKPSTRPQEAE